MFSPCGLHKIVSSSRTSTSANKHPLPGQFLSGQLHQCICIFCICCHTWLLLNLSSGGYWLFRYLDEGQEGGAQLLFGELFKLTLGMIKESCAEGAESWKSRDSVRRRRTPHVAADTRRTHFISNVAEHCSSLIIPGGQ